MAVSVLTSGVFGTAFMTDSTGIHIPLSSIRYRDGTITESEAVNDYRALIRGINQTYYYFMTGTATGADNVDGWNKPAYFSMERPKPSVGGTAALPTLALKQTTNFTYKLDNGSDSTSLPPE